MQPGIEFNKKLNITSLVLNGQKTMFRLPSKKKKEGKLLNTTKFQVGDIVPILQSYKDVGIDAHELLDVVEGNINAHLEAKDTKGWTRASAVDPGIMPHAIQIVDIKTELMQDISEADCLLEGIIPVNTSDISTLDGCMPFDGYALDGKTWIADTPIETFKLISDCVVKKNAWKNNILVDCYTFKLLR